MQTKRIWRGDVLLLLVLAGLLLVLVTAGVGRSTPASGTVANLLPTPTPQPTPTGGWWDHVSMTPGPQEKLPGIPSLPALQAGQGGVSAPAGNQPVAFKVVACSQATSQITKIVTGRPGWWLVTGTATGANLDYWKMELSADGQNWTMLYRRRRQSTRPAAGLQHPDGPGRRLSIAPGAGGQNRQLHRPCTVQITITR